MYLIVFVFLQGEMGLPGMPGSSGQPGPKVIMHVFAFCNVVIHMENIIGIDY